MADRESIYGIKYEVNIDDLKTSVAEARNKIKQANAEFNESASKLDNWADSVDGVSAKLKQLNTVLEAEKSKLAQNQKQYNSTIDLINKYTNDIDELKQKKQQAIEQYGEESSEVKELNKEINRLERAQYKAVDTAEKLKTTISNQQASVNRTERSINNYNEELEELKEAQRRAESSGRSLKEELEDIRKTSDKIESSVGELADGFTIAKGAIAGFIANGLNNLISGLKSSIEETREYRAELGKLQATAQTTGSSFDNVKDNLREVNAITNDTGAGVEGLNNLLSANFDGKLLNDITDQLLGASIKWKDTLKFEGLADGLQETLATGKAVGPFAELLERCGAVLEDFDKGLQKAIKSGNQQQYVLDYLSKYGLKDVKEAYEQNEKALIDSANATFDFNDRMAMTGKKTEPIVASVKKGFITLFDEIVKGTDSADIEGFADDITGGFNKIKGGISWFKSNLKPITVLVAGLTAAWLANKNAQLLANGAAIATKATTILMTGVTKGATLATNAHTLATNGATLAQKAFNLAQKASPLGMVTTLLIGATAAVGSYIFSLANEKTEHEKNIEAMDKEIASRKEIINSQKEAIASGLGEIENTKALNNELKNLTDQNGKVKAGYEGRVGFILNELNTALGTEMKLNNGVIEGYKEFSGQIDNMIEKKRAEIIIEAQLPAYKEAVTKSLEAQTKANKLNAELTELNIEKMTKEAELVKKFGADWKNDIEAKTSGLFYQWSQLEHDTAVKEKEFNKQNKIVKGYYDDIATYEANATRLASGNAEEIAKIETSILAKKATTIQEKKALLEQQKQAEEAHLQYLKDKYKGTNDTIELQQIESQQRKVQNVQNELDAMTSTVDTKKGGYVTAWDIMNNVVLGILNSKKDQFSKAGADSAEAVKNGMNSKGTPLFTAATVLAQNSADKFYNEYQKFYDAGAHAADGIEKGSSSKNNSIFGAMASLASGMVKTFRKNLEIKSPSRIFMKLASYIPEGIKKGIERNKGRAISAVEKMTNEVATAGEKIKNNIYLNDVKTKLKTTIAKQAPQMALAGAGSSNISNVTFNQYNTSPKALDSLEVYRNTQKQINLFKKWKGQ